MAKAENTKGGTCARQVEGKKIKSENKEGILV